ncbi:MAG: hypothetical protein U5K00_22755 [Melioribacteraceae bacterium]|nr:hypothetical protein [Melioribacteraceae bacterium]
MKYITILFLLLTITSTFSFAQWEQLGTDEGLPSYSLKVNTVGTVNENVIISTVSDGLYLSEDNGATWRRPSGNYPADAYFNGSATLNGKIFAGSAWNGIGVFMSADKGETWDTLNNGLNDGSLGITANTILGAHNGILFLGASKFYISNDEGANWQVSSSGLPVNGAPWAVAYDGTNYYCSYKKVYSSIDGLNWTIVDNTDLPFTAIIDLISIGDNLIAVSQNTGIYYSTDNGNSWSEVNGFSENDFSSVRDLLLWNGEIYAATAGRVYHSTDEGLTWSLLASNRHSTERLNNSKRYIILFICGTKHINIR